MSLVSLFINSQLRTLYHTVKSTAELTIITTVRHQGNALTDTFNANRVQCLKLQVHTSKIVDIISYNNNNNKPFLSSMLHGSETWPVRKKNEVALQRTEMRIVRWMFGMKLQDRISSKGLRETGIR